MARGWESKSVESQQTAEDLGGAKRKLTAEERELVSKRATLELSRDRIVRELATARSGVHRTALENALAHLDGELAKLR
jgi:DNA-directed RNA polymerase specialized sigma subunit